MLVSYSIEIFTLLSIYFAVCLPAAAVNSPLNRVLTSERENVLQRTKQEVDELYSWYEQQLTRSEACGIGAAYARYSTKYQESIADQLRRMLRQAIELRVYVPREFIFFDLSISGRKKRRKGIDELESVLREKKVQTLFLFATNRLHRKTYRTLEFADRVVKNWNIRILFVAQGIDSNNTKQWEPLLMTHAMVDQFVVTMYGENIRAAHEGLFAKQYVFGSISYGYYGEVIAEEFSPKGKPRRRLKIDRDQARVVAMIFHLFVVERKALNEIARVLNNDASIPLPPLCRSGHWSNDTVRRVLMNTRYRGLWKYGVTESVYLSEADYIGKKVRTEPLQEAQFEELRIVNDDIWFAAAKLLMKRRGGGRHPKDGNHRARPKVLNGILYCAKHERPLVAAGAHGRHMVCPVCQCLPKSKRSLLSWLNRAVALRLVCEELSRRILTDTELVERAVEACRHAAEEEGRADPGALAGIVAKRDKLQRQVEFLVRNVGESEADQLQSQQILRELRTEKAQVEGELSKLTAARKKTIQIPTAEDVRRLLASFSDILIDASHGDDPANRATARLLIEELTGGRISLFQQHDAERQEKWLRGVFRLRLFATVLDHISQGGLVADDEGGEVVIEFKRPLATDSKAEVAWRLHNEKKRHAEIAQELGCSSTYVTKLLHHYADQHGLDWIDGRSESRNFPIENRPPALFKQIAEQVMEMFQGNALLAEIASRFNVHVATIRKAVKWWHEQRGLPVPNGRTRAGRLRRS